MNRHVTSVFRIQLALFMRERGMLVFYFICALLAGMIVPIFYQGMDAAIQMAGFFTIIFLKPILADSLAGERERKTLESLLSSSVPGKAAIWGKLLFGILFSSLFFLVTVVFAAITCLLTHRGTDIKGWQWFCAISASLLNFAAISIAGTYISAVSEDLRTANSKISSSAYPLGLLQLVYLAVVFSAEMLPAFLIGTVIIILSLSIMLGCLRRIWKMKQSQFFENVTTRKSKKYRSGQAGYHGSKSPFAAVFGHEMRYLLTLKSLLLRFLLLCFCPAAIVCILKYYTGETNLYYAVLLTALMMPRAPANLIAYSIGGEKVYKTGESLLSTPLTLRAVFLAKSMIPIVVSGIMLAASSLITLIPANVIGRYLEGGRVYLYTAGQLMLLFPVGFMSCITMVFLTGFVSVSMKTPRQGLYASSLLGILFVLPVWAIAYLVQDTLMWATIYFLLLFAANIICLIRISSKTGRPQIMMKI